MLHHNKLYILGLFVGNGTIANNTFIIKLPFKKWGMSPNKMSDIARDILTKISSKFQDNYHFSINYEIGNSEWIIKPIEAAKITSIKSDLSLLGLPTEGFLLKSANLAKAKTILKGIQVENFLSGIFDTRCSLTKSHRRFTDEAPIVSLEIPGSTKNFRFVKDICSWLTELGTITDQILYNHPNQHSASDPNYTGWKKGFKIRFLVSSFLAKNSFALKAKAVDIGKLEKRQAKDEQVPCTKRKIRKPSPVCIHADINSSTLPDEVKNKIFFHYHHYCAVMGCKYAPIGEVKRIVADYKSYIFALPRMEKGNYSDVVKYFSDLIHKHFLSPSIIVRQLLVQDVLQNEELQKYLELEQAIAFLFSKKLNGKRHCGPKDKILSDNLNKTINIHSVQSVRLSPLLLGNKENNRGVLISALESELNQRLIDEHIMIDGLNVKVK